MKKIFFILFSAVIAQTVCGQDETAIRGYIDHYKEIAISEMQRTGVPASIKLAQGIHETFAGQSTLVLKSNNHFGIKCKTEWRGESVKHDDDARNECFRKYSTAADSYQDHSNFLKGSERYAFLFRLPPTDYSGWAYGLKKAGYATNPKYAPIIIKLIEDFNLQDYTLIAMGKLKEPAVSYVKNDLPSQAEDKKEIVAEIKQAVVIQQGKRPEEIFSNKESAKTYPAGEFKINETKVVYISKGTSFLLVAGQYDVPLSRIFEFNDMTENETAEKDQLIYIQRKRKTGNNEFHIVKPGETLHDIAQEEALRIESLLEYNFLSINQKPAIGEKLFLRTKATVQPRLALNENVTLNYPANIKLQEKATIPAQIDHSAARAQAVEHKVEPKETIYSIARRYNVKIDDIVKWNNLEGYDLRTGQQLKIYKL